MIIGKKIENERYKDGEPTDLYIAFMRIGGLFFMFASIIFSVVCFA